MRSFPVVVASLVASTAFATLPPAPPEAQAKANEAKAKADWSDKSGAYQLCLTQDRVADAYRRDLKAQGKPVPAAMPTASCTDPGPYATPEQQKPLEASEAHSPTGTATSPPSRNEHATELMGSPKKR